MITFRELIETDHVTVFDGAMGTQLYAKGVYINRSYDELNLTNPDLVRTVHEEYVRAGAAGTETNRVTATAPRAARCAAPTRARAPAGRGECVRAGAEVIETNTFTATAHKLQQYGLEGR